MRVDTKKKMANGKRVKIGSMALLLLQTDGRIRRQESALDRDERLKKYPLLHDPNYILPNGERIGNLQPYQVRAAFIAGYFEAEHHAHFKKLKRRLGNLPRPRRAA